MALSRYPKMTLPYSLHFALHSGPLKLLYNKGQSTAAQRAYTALIVTGDVGIHSQFFFFPLPPKTKFLPLTHDLYFIPLTSIIQDFGVVQRCVKT